MATSNRSSVQNQQPMANLKFFVKEVYTSRMLAMKIMSKKSAAELYGSLCKFQGGGGGNISKVTGEEVDAQLLYLVR